MTAADPTQTEGAGGDPASAAATTTAQAPPEADFLRRARENPQWAEDQVRQSQSTKDRAEAATAKLVEQYEPVRVLVDQYGGTTIASAVENYRAIRNSPEIGEMIQEFERTGQLPARKGSESNNDDGEYKTPEELEIVELKAQLSKVAADTKVNTLASGRQVLEGHMEKVFSEYGFSPEDIQQMRTGMKAQFETWKNLGSAGENALKSLMSVGGEATVRGIMLSTITPESLRAAAINTDLRKRQGLSRLATDGPSGIGSAGKEAPTEFSSAFEAAEFARANPEGHDSY